MFLARAFRGGSPQVYRLCGVPFVPRVWRFFSFKIGAAAIARTQTEALGAARRELSNKVRHES